VDNFTALSLTSLFITAFKYLICLFGGWGWELKENHCIRGENPFIKMLHQKLQMQLREDGCFFLRRSGFIFWLCAIIRVGLVKACMV